MANPVAITIKRTTKRKHRKLYISILCFPPPASLPYICKNRKRIEVTFQLTNTILKKKHLHMINMKL